MRFEQYEIWVPNEGRWELIGTFRDFDVAATVASSRGRRLRLVRAIYEDGQRVQEDVLADVGSTRDEP